jgi:hypothetical protein
LCYYDAPRTFTFRNGVPDFKTNPMDLATATIEQLFTRLQEIIAEGPDVLSVRYDAVYGFPEYIAVEYDSSMTDTTVTYYVTNFQVLPPDP